MVTSVKTHNNNSNHNKLYFRAKPPVLSQTMAIGSTNIAVDSKKEPNKPASNMQGISSQAYAGS